jgi:DNA-binding CsgD family transcriptional regulator
MQLYQGKYLTINFEKQEDLFFQQWNDLELTIEEFKTEMLVYCELYKQYTPSFTLWNQQNFTLQLDEKTYGWIEEYINMPCFEYGNKKAAFIVGKDVLAHLEVSNSFKEVKSVINVKHFLLEEKAREWLKSIDVQLSAKENAEIFFDGVDDNGHAIFKINTTSTDDVERVIKLFKELIEDVNFTKKYKEAYALLTKREKQVLKLYAEGESMKMISEKLIVSIHTISTHIKRIKYKLNIKSSYQALKYVKAFDV